MQKMKEAASEVSHPQAGGFRSGYGLYWSSFSARLARVGIRSPPPVLLSA